MQDTQCKWLPNITVETINNCGHFPMLESPLLLAASLARFIIFILPLSDARSHQGNFAALRRDTYSRSASFMRVCQPSPVA